MNAVPLMSQRQQDCVGASASQWNELIPAPRAKSADPQVNKCIQYFLLKNYCLKLQQLKGSMSALDYSHCQSMPAVQPCAVCATAEQLSVQPLLIKGSMYCT